MWRPKEGWENPHKKDGILEIPEGYSHVDMQESFEAGADAMLDSLFKLAEESPTKTFTLDSRKVTIYDTSTTT